PHRDRGPPHADARPERALRLPPALRGDRAQGACRRLNRCSVTDFFADLEARGGGGGSFSPSQRAASSSGSIPTVRSRSLRCSTPRVVSGFFRPIAGSLTHSVGV